MADQMATSYPQSEKLSKNADARDTLIEFFEWMDGKGLHIAEYVKYPSWRDEVLAPISESRDDLALRFLGIDPKVLEQERRAMLEDIRG